MRPNERGAFAQCTGADKKFVSGRYVAHMDITFHMY